MDIQIKKGLAESLVLFVVSGEDVYGYKLMQDISGMMPMSESTLYPILRRLEAGGFVAAYSREFNGRLRKYYSITPIGRGRLDEYKEQWREVRGIIDNLLREEESA